QRAEGKAGEDAAAFTETADERADEHAGNDAGADANYREGQTDVACGPRVAILRVDDEDGGQGLLREIEEGHHAGETEELRMRTEERQRAERIGHVPRGFGAPLLRKRFGKNEKTIHGIGEAERGSGPKGKAQVDVAEESTDGRSDDEAHAERSSEITELLGAFVGRGDVGDVGEGAGNIGGGDAGNDAAHEKPFERGGEGHEDVVEAEAETGNEDDRAAAKAVGPRAENGRKNKLHERPDKSEIAGDGGGAGEVAAFELDDEVGKNGRNDAESQKIEEHGDKNEYESGATALGLRSWGRGGGQAGS